MGKGCLDHIIQTLASYAPKWSNACISCVNVFLSEVHCQNHFNEKKIMSCACVSGENKKKLRNQHGSKCESLVWSLCILPKGKLNGVKLQIH